MCPFFFLAPGRERRSTSHEGACERLSREFIPRALVEVTTGELLSELHEGVLVLRPPRAPLLEEERDGVWESPAGWAIAHRAQFQNSPPGFVPRLL